MAPALSCFQGADGCCIYSTIVTLLRLVLRVDFWRAVMLAGGNAQTGTLFNSTSTRLIVPGASEVYFYHQANNSWRSAANFSNSPAGRGAFQMVKLPDGKILAAGGDLSLKNSSDAFIGLGYFGRSAETFDPVTNSWTVTGDMSASRFDQNMVQLPDGKGGPIFNLERMWRS